jgi:hypothetical protein
MNYKGSCHCGAIAFEVEGDLVLARPRESIGDQAFSATRQPSLDAGRQVGHEK